MSQSYMTSLLKSLVRSIARKSHHVVLDVRKDQPLFHFHPGHLKKVFGAMGVNCVIDVGANRGSFAAMVRGAGYSGRIVSLEPAPDSYATLAARAATDSAWRTLPIALGDVDEERALNVFAASDLNSFLPASEHLASNVDGSQVTKTVAVEVRKLDTVFGEIVSGIQQPRVFLKLDTQGYDLKAVAGATTSLPSIVGIQSELSLISLYEGMPDYLEALATYRRLGFSPTAFFPVVHERTSGHILEVDVVLTRSGAR